MKKRLIFIILLSIVSYLLPLGGHDERVVFSILVLAALLWVTETIPLFLTSLIITCLIVLFGIFTFSEAVVKFADPILVLFFAGFLIARSMMEINLHKRIALQISSKVKNDKYELLTLMFITAFLSMWISNTATTVLMIPIALGIVHKFNKKMKNFGKATVLGIAYSANIGGIGTIIGSPPNAITTAKLMEISNVHVSFLDWMIATLPLAIILIPIAWLVLMWMFPFEKAYMDQEIRVPKLNKEQKKFYAIFVLTLAALVTTNLHGVSSYLVLLLSAIALFIFGLLEPDDINKINYKILILFGGGLVLGSAMFSVGLSDFFATQLANAVQKTLMIPSIVLLTMGISSFASNTATSAIIMPVILPLAKAVGIAPKVMGLSAGVAASMIYMLPVGTPPNAIAYATEKIAIKDMLKAGAMMTLVSFAVLLAAAAFLW